MTSDEQHLEDEELCAGEMRVVCGDGAFRHVGQPRDLMSGVRREGQNLCNATGRAVSAMRRLRAARRVAPVPDVLRHWLVAGYLD